VSLSSILLATMSTSGVGLLFMMGSFGNGATLVNVEDVKECCWRAVCGSTAIFHHQATTDAGGKTYHHERLLRDAKAEGIMDPAAPEDEDGRQDRD
jgi:hypothetical protein